MITVRPDEYSIRELLRRVRALETRAPNRSSEIIDSIRGDMGDVRGKANAAQSRADEAHAKGSSALGEAQKAQIAAAEAHAKGSSALGEAQKAQIAAAAAHSAANSAQSSANTARNIANGAANAARTAQASANDAASQAARAIRMHDSVGAYMRSLEMRISRLEDRIRGRA